jgi:hypothetical protein
MNNSAAPAQLKNPFELALGDELKALHPLIYKHFSVNQGTLKYSGRMRKIWHLSDWRRIFLLPALYFASTLDMLFPEIGCDIKFELENRIAIVNGQIEMAWVRTFMLPAKTRIFAADMTYDEKRQVIIDWFGKGYMLEVELHPEIIDGMMLIKSGRQSLRLGLLRIPLPNFLAASATVREWTQDGVDHEISVILHNPMLGDFFGYEGSFQEQTDSTA